MAVAKKVARPAQSLSNHKPDLWAKFAFARQEMAAALVEREEEVDLLLTALLSREHCLFVGAPGSAKSMLCDMLGKWVSEKPFDYLLTKFSMPEELFGPIDLLALKAGENKRNIDGYLPTSSLAFLDEIWKASSAILNTLLKVLNERRFKYGKQEADCPLLLAVGASNEWPPEEGGKELGALLDRFLLRKTVRYVSPAGRRELLKRRVANQLGSVKFSQTITPDEINQAADEAGLLPWSDQAKRDLWKILEELNREGIYPGDRRITKSIGVARAAAYLDGASEVKTEHLAVLAHVLWDDPTEQPQKTARVVGKIANPTQFAINDLLSQATDVVAKSPPTEAVPKLQAIGKELEKLAPAGGLRDKAHSFVAQMIKDSYNAIIGVGGAE